MDRGGQIFLGVLALSLGSCGLVVSGLVVNTYLTNAAHEQEEAARYDASVRSKRLSAAPRQPW